MVTTIIIVAGALCVFAFGVGLGLRHRAVDPVAHVKALESIATEKARREAAEQRVDEWRERTARWEQLYLDERNRVTPPRRVVTDEPIEDPPSVGQADLDALLSRAVPRDREHAATFAGREAVAVDDEDAAPPHRLTDED